MDEILPGVWHWTAPHPNIGGKPVSSYWLEDGGVLVDPLIPSDAGLEWFATRPTPPTAIVLTSRHHYRASGSFRERFSCVVHVPREGLHEFKDRQPVSTYEHGEELPGGLRAFQIGVLCPDDYGLHRPTSRSLWLADAVVRCYDPAARPGWVLDQLMDEPEQTKVKLLQTLGRVLRELEFDHVLLAHGMPMVGDGRAKLEELIASGGRTATDAFA